MMTPDTAAAAADVTLPMYSIRFSARSITRGRPRSGTPLPSGQSPLTHANPSDSRKSMSRLPSSSPETRTKTRPSSINFRAILSVSTHIFPSSIIIGFPFAAKRKHETRHGQIIGNTAILTGLLTGHSAYYQANWAKPGGCCERPFGEGAEQPPPVLCVWDGHSFQAAGGSPSEGFAKQRLRCRHSDLCADEDEGELQVRGLGSRPLRDRY